MDDIINGQSRLVIVLASFGIDAIVEFVSFLRSFTHIVYDEGVLFAQVLQLVAFDHHQFYCGDGSDAGTTNTIQVLVVEKRKE